METAQLLSKLNKALPKAVLQKQRFGKSETLCLWVEARRLREVGRFLLESPDTAFDFAENFAVAELEGALVATYFLRSTKHHFELILRCSTSLPKNGGEAELESLSDIWPMLRPVEAEVAELFGVRFLDQTGQPKEQPRNLLPPGWKGYPLRKDYAFPEEVSGIAHVSQRAGER